MRTDIHFLRMWKGETPVPSSRRHKEPAGRLRRALPAMLLVLAAGVCPLPFCGMDTAAIAAPIGAGIDYDIIYVRYPRNGNTGEIEMPQGELPDRIESGADLMLLHPDGSEEVLVGCRDPLGYVSYNTEAGDVSASGVPASQWPNCAVQDPVVSFDGQWVYYSKYVNVNDLSKFLTTDAYIFKMQIGGTNPQKREIQLTNGSTRFTHDGYAGNTFPADDIPFGVRDMGPALLPNGDLVFTSNRSGLIPPRQGNQGNKTSPERLLTAQLYRMSDHDGSLPNRNLRPIGHADMHLVQHPTVLADGRILFSNWDDVGLKHKYAMLTLYVINPDGSNLQMFMEPHDFHKRLDHFVTQTGGGNAVVVSYYPGNLWGFGLLFRMPVDVPGPDFQLDQLTGENHYRPFSRKGTVNMTPHTDGADKAAPNNSGRYSMPSAAPDGRLLTAYSPGPVSGGGPKGIQYPLLDAGLYLINNADTAFITDPAAQLVQLTNRPEFNEIWPRAVVPYQRVHGVARPTVIPDTPNAGTLDARLPAGTPFSLFGTSSIYNRQSAPLDGDAFYPGTKRETANGTWQVQGAQTGIFTNSDIYGVRIIVTVPKPWVNPYQITAEEQTLLYDSRLDRHVEGFTANQSERWKILGEFPVKKHDTAGNIICNPAEPLLNRDREGRTDPANPYVSTAQGPCGTMSPDTSFLALIPANTPFFVQGIDRNGMTLFTEQTWRHTVPGEKRTDCGGCHGHTIPPVAFEGTEASKPGYAVWDLARKTPFISSDASGNPVVSYRKASNGQDTGLWGIEYYRDIKPILDSKCASCHDASNNTTGTDLVLNDPTDSAYWRLTRDSKAKYGGSPPGGHPDYVLPQVSKYVRALQARESLLVWKIFGSRLDGRTNGERADDIDYTGQPMPPPGAPQLTEEEKRLIARWIDLGAPMDLLNRPKNRYTEDDLMPVVAVTEPARDRVPNAWSRVVLGLDDLESGVNMSSLSLTLNFDVPGYPAGTNLAGLATFDPQTSVATFQLPGGPYPTNADHTLSVAVSDNAGNTYREKVVFSIAASSILPPQNVNVILVP